MPWTPDRLGEDIWAWFKPEDFAGSWADSTGIMTATPLDGSPRGAGDFVAFDVGDALEIPYQQMAHRAHRTAVFVVSFDSVPSDSGWFAYFNGADGGRSKMPAFGWHNGEFTAEWKAWDRPYTHAWPAPLGTHVIATWRQDGVIYGSFDGSPPTGIGENVTFNVQKNRKVGQIGGDLAFKAGDLIVCQNDIRQERIDKLVGWAAHKYGIALDSRHPYADAAPEEAPDDALPYVETSRDEWDAISLYFKGDTFTAPKLWDHQGEPWDMSGWSLDFHDPFDTMTVTDEEQGSGPWWAPVHPAAAGKAQVGRIDSDPPVYTQSGSELTLHLRELNNGRFRGAVISSCNVNGRGRVYEAPFAVLWKARMRDNGNPPGAWTAFWMKSVNEFIRLTESECEMDFIEPINWEPSGIDFTQHVINAWRKLPGRWEKRHYLSEFFRVGSGTSTPWSPTSLWDDQWKWYGATIEPDFVRVFFGTAEDRIIEIARWPATREVLKPQWLIADIARHSKHKDDARDHYELIIDDCWVYRK
jgi:hypothetical protein